MNFQKETSNDGKHYDLARLWNQVLTSSSISNDLTPSTSTTILNSASKTLNVNKKDCENADYIYIYLDNYVYQMQYLILCENLHSITINDNKHQSKKQQEPSFNNNSNNNNKLSKVIINCNNMLRKNSKINDYVNENENKEETILIRKKLTNKNNQSECIELLDSSLNKVKLSLVEVKGDITEINEFHNKPLSTTNLNEANFDRNTKEASNSDLELISNEKVLELIKSIKKSCLDEDVESLKNLFRELSHLNQSDFLQKFCSYLLDIENFTIEKINLNPEINCISLKEIDLILMLNSLIDLNTSTTILSYNLSYCYIKHLLSDYVILLVSQTNSSNASDTILSRKLLITCGVILQTFTRQFISSCMIQWIIEMNSGQTSTDLKKFQIINEFLLKIIKDYFKENECLILIQQLITEYASIKWTEACYTIVSNLIEKIANLNLELFCLLINQMRNDSESLPKSNCFSKLLMTLVNKYKHHLLGGTIGLESNKEVNKENLGPFSQSELIYENRVEKNILPSSKISHLIEAINHIIEKNQTIMKRTLINVIKNLKNN